MLPPTTRAPWQSFVGSCPEQKTCELLAGVRILRFAAEALAILDYCPAALLGRQSRIIIRVYVGTHRENAVNQFPSVF
jgi:hypothetical protein